MEALVWPGTVLALMLVLKLVLIRRERELERRRNVHDGDAGVAPSHTITTEYGLYNVGDRLCRGSDRVVVQVTRTTGGGDLVVWAHEYQVRG